MRVKNLRFSNMKSLVKNPMISYGYVDILYAGKNRNYSYISDEVMKNKLAPSIKGIPIVGEYFNEINDFGDHGGKVIIDSQGIKFEVTTVPYGFVPPDATIEYVEKIDKDNVTRKYLRTECYLWTGQFPECDRVIKTNNPQSMELEEPTGYWKTIEGEEYYVIEDAIVSKLCILGTEVEPCFEGACFGTYDENNTLYSLNNKEEYTKFIEQFSLEVKKALDQEGGLEMSLGNKENQIDNKPETQDENQNFKKETDEDKKKKEQDTTQDNKDNVDNTDDEEKKKKKQDNEDDYVDNKKKKQCSLEEYEQKVQELNEQIFQLTKSLTEQQNLFNSMKDDFEKLSQFKKDIDKENKYKLINKFKMKNIISQDDIHNIEQKIDEYSYEELNNKLCCLYTSKMLDYEEDTNNFEEEEKNKKKMYNLNNSVPKDENTDSWENQVKARQKKN